MMMDRMAARPRTSRASRPSRRSASSTSTRFREEHLAPRFDHVGRDVQPAQAKYEQNYVVHGELPF